MLEENDGWVGTRSTSATAASATGSRTTSTGPSRAIGSGAHRSPCGAARSAAPTPASPRSQSSLRFRARTSPSSTRIARSWTTSPSRAPSAVEPRVASNRCSTRGSTRAPCPPRSSITPSSTKTPSSDGSRPTSSRGDRPDTGMVLLTARGQHPRLRPVAVPQRASVSPTSSTRTGRRCRSPRAT